MPSWHLFAEVCMGISGRVLVCGAGPTGLVSALELARRGIDVRIVGKRSYKNQELGKFCCSKSFISTFQHKTVQLLDLYNYAYNSCTAHWKKLLLTPLFRLTQTETLF